MPTFINHRRPFASARERDQVLYSVPDAVRQAASVTFFNVLKLTYRIAKANGANETQLQDLRRQFTDYANKLIAIQDPRYQGGGHPNSIRYSENEDFFVLCLLKVGFASFPLAIASYLAGYIILPVTFTALSLVFAATTWIGASPILAKPNTLAPMIHTEFSPRPIAFAANMANTGMGYFASLVSLFTAEPANDGIDHEHPANRYRGMT